MAPDPSPLPPGVPVAIAALPRFALLDGPSPLQPLPRFSAALGGGAEIWIKREDLLPLAFGGNKLRNLEFLVGAALAEGADTLVTAGRRWSNHCRLTAAAGAKAGLAVDLVVTGPPRGTTGANERLDTLLGATVHAAAGPDRADRDRRLAEVVRDRIAEGRRPFVIPVGGSSTSDGRPMGAAGQVLAGLELAAQAAERGLAVDTVVVPSATGGTQAGLLLGLAIAAAPTQVLGVAVTPPDELRPIVAGLLDALAPLAGRSPEDWSDRIEIDPDRLGAGYGRPSAGATAAAELLARTEGLLVDPIYTAKGLAGLIAGVREGRLAGTVVFWHAGGLPGLFEDLDGTERPRF